MGSLQAWATYLASQDSNQIASQSLLEELADRESTVFIEDEPIFDVIDVTADGIRTRDLVEEDEFSAFLDESTRPPLRIISVCQDASILPLNITSSWAASLFLKYQVKIDFLRILLSFGEVPRILQASSANNARYDEEGDIVLYRLSFAERHKQGGLNPWAMRQIGVYHHHTEDADLFIIIHGSSSSVLYQTLSKFAGSTKDETRVEPLTHARLLETKDLHNLALSSYMDNWRPYIRELESCYTRINDQAMVAKVSVTGEASFHKVQTLRNTRDKVSYAIACCSSNMEVLNSTLPPQNHARAARSIQAWHVLLTGCIKSAKMLQDSIANSIELVGYTLTFHNQLELRDVSNEMRNHAQETGIITKRLKELTENTVDDSAIVRMITVVSAIYLPGSFVASVFGTNFFVFDGSSLTITIAHDFWKFIVSWLALTIVTCAVYAIVYLQKRRSRTERSRLGEKQLGV